MPIAYNAGMNTRGWLIGALLAYCGSVLAGAEAAAPCSENWNRYIDEKVVTGDGQGHGPDVGSLEWRSVVEFKLGIRGQPDLPARDSDDWCQLIDRLVREQ